MISYGWGHGHVRVNNRAFMRFGLAQVATDREQLRAALQRALASPPPAGASAGRAPAGGGRASTSSRP